MVTEKRISLNDNSFFAGGKKFIIHSSVNIERYRVLEELQVRAGYGASYAQLYRGYEKVVKLINEGKRYQADIEMNNMMQGVARKLNKQHDPMLLIATLVCCEETEDTTVWSEESANEKIELWSKEGYPVEDFFPLSLRLCRRYQENLFEGIQDISEETDQET